MAAPLIMALAFGFVAIMLAIAMIVDQFKKHTAQRENALITEARDYRTDEVIKAVFMAANKSPQFRQRSVNMQIISGLLLKLLKDRYGNKLKIHQEMCSMVDRNEDPSGKKLDSCTTILGIEIAGGQQMLLHMSYSLRDFLRWKTKDVAWNLPSLNHSITDWITDKKEISIANGLQLAYPASLNDDSPEVSELFKVLEESRVEFINVEPEMDEESDISHFILSKEHGELRLKSNYRNIPIMGDKLLDLSYSNMNFDYNGNTYKIPMSRGVRLLADVFVRNSESVAIFGKMGYGKSYLADEISRLVGNNSRLKIVYMPPQIFKDLTNLETIGQLQVALSNLTEEGDRVVFFVDEAEQLLRKTNDGIHSLEAATLLTAMDGTLQKLLNCSFVLTFNANIEELNQAAFRAGRMGAIVKLEDLTESQTTALVEELQMRNANMVFDQKKWESIKQRNQVIALADVYSCFYPKSKQRKIEALLQELGLEGMEKKKITVPAPSAPRIPTPTIPAATNTPAAQPEQAIPNGNANAMRHKHGNKKGKWDKNRR